MASSVDQLEDALLSSPPVSQGELSGCPESRSFCSYFRDQPLHHLTLRSTRSHQLRKPPAQQDKLGVGLHISLPLLLPWRQEAVAKGPEEASAFSVKAVQGQARRFLAGPRCFTSNFRALTLAFDTPWRGLNMQTNCMSKIPTRTSLPPRPSQTTVPAGNPVYGCSDRLPFSGKAKLHP